MLCPTSLQFAHAIPSTYHALPTFVNLENFYIFLKMQLKFFFGEIVLLLLCSLHYFAHTSCKTLTQCITSGPW